MPGRWCVTARVQWQTCDRDFTVDLDHLFQVHDAIEVKAGETTKVVLPGR
ncbi:MAG: hypothetical protein U1E62_23150 [Alsobacter sp.]